MGVTLFAAASAACGFSANVEQLVVARCIQGIGAAFLVPSSLAIISSAFDEASRGKAIGTWSGFTAITTAVGPVLGGWLVQHGSWHWVFFINLPIAAAVIAITLGYIPETRSAGGRRIDWPGAACATVGLGGLIYGFLESGALGWANPQVWGSLVLGFGGLALFAVVESRSAEPMVPLSLFRSRTFSGANLLTLLLYAALGIFFFLYPLNLIQVQGYSPTATGAAALPMIGLLFLLSRWSGGLVARYGARTPLIVGPVIAAAGFAVFAVPGVGGNYWTTFFPGFLVLGLGMAVSIAPLTTVVMSSVAQDRAGTASGINNAVARVAGVLAIAVLGIVMVVAFSQRLQTSLDQMNLPANVVNEIQSNAIKLAGIPMPANVDAKASSAIHTAITTAFLFAFRTIMLICAALALASAGFAVRMIPAHAKEGSEYGKSAMTSSDRRVATPATS